MQKNCRTTSADIKKICVKQTVWLKVEGSGSALVEECYELYIDLS